MAMLKTIEPQPKTATSNRIDLSRATEFIPQVAEDGYGAKRSCSLTSQLNAYLAMNALDTYSAQHIQDELCTDARYDRLWSPPVAGPDKNWRAWATHPFRLWVILNTIYDLDVEKPLPLGARPDDYLVPQVDRHLRTGGVAMLVGRSTVATHARIAFEPAGFEGTIFVYDPQYPETTGLYDYAALDDLQTEPRAILY